MALTEGTSRLSNIARQDTVAHSPEQVGSDRDGAWPRLPGDARIGGQREAPRAGQREEPLIGILHLRLLAVLRHDDGAPAVGTGVDQRSPKVVQRSTAHVGAVGVGNRVVCFVVRTIARKDPGPRWWSST